MKNSSKIIIVLVVVVVIVIGIFAIKNNTAKDVENSGGESKIEKEVVINRTGENSIKDENITNKNKTNEVVLEYQKIETEEGTKMVDQFGDEMKPYSK